MHPGCILMNQLEKTMRAGSEGAFNPSDPRYCCAVVSLIGRVVLHALKMKTASKLKPETG